MDEKHLIDAFDTYNPTDEQKQKMFDKITKKAYAPYKFDFKKVYIPLVTVAAATFIFVLGGVFNKAPVVNTEVAILQNTPTVYDTTEKQAVSETVPQPKARIKNETEPSQNQQASNYNEILKEAEDSTAQYDKQPQMLAVNKISDVDVCDGAAGGVSSAAYTQADTEQNTYSYTSFCELIGNDIADSICVPSDMVNTTQKEKTANGNLTEWDITYEGQNQRSISINMSLDTDKNNAVLSDEALQKSTINGINAIVTDNGNLSAYISTQSLSYTIKTVGITEAEMEELLISVAK